MNARLTQGVSALLLVAAACQAARPLYIGCQSSQECAKEACCVIGMGRYSIPRCEPRRESGESCRPRATPTNTTLHYPDGASVPLSGVYYLLCPCQSGLSCQEAGDSPQCADVQQSNHIFEYEESEY